MYDFDYADRWQLEMLEFPRKPENPDEPPKPSALCTRRLQGLFQHGWSEGQLPQWKDTTAVYQVAERTYTKQEGEDKSLLQTMLDEREYTETMLYIYSLIGRDPREIDLPNKVNIASKFYTHNKRSRDFRVYAMLASKKYNLPIEAWITRRLIQKLHENDKVPILNARGETIYTAWEPDDICVLRLNDDILSWYPIEIDMTTESLDDFALKVRASREYLKRKIYQSRYRTNSGRILTITTGERRLKNLKEVTEAEGGKHRYWFTTWDKVNQDTIFTKPIWEIATHPQGELHVATEF